MKQFINDLLYVITNNLVCYIPFWPLRRLCYRLLGMSIGKGSRILMKTVIVAPRGITIGEHTYINENCYLDGRGGLEIGSNVTIAIYSKIISGGHIIDDDNFEYCSGKVKIGNNVVLFACTVVLGGAEIQKGCVFSAMSLVRKGVYEEKGFYGGNPAKYIRKRESTCEYVQNYWHPILR